jgi:4-phytase/acid phosphatase
MIASLRCAFGALLCAATASSGIAANRAPHGVLVVERAVLVMRHGIRAPLDGEVPASTRTGKPWPRWPVAQSAITPHGERALEIVANADRQLLAAHGLLPSSGCPARGAVQIHANNSIRTIASAAAYARGFARGCTIDISHRPVGDIDPIFEPVRARATAFDGHQAVLAINRETGGMEALVERHRAALTELDGILGCTPSSAGCLAAGKPGLVATADGRDIVLSGDIRAASGIAQVLLLEYVEGLPRDNVGWGRIDAAGLKRLGALHAALFAGYTKPAYMAAHQTAALGREVLRGLDAAAPHRLEVLMGHDTNVTALAAALGVGLEAPGYATNDVPPGGALLLERVKDMRSGQVFARVWYRTQSPDALRGLSSKTSLRPVRVRGCKMTLCPIRQFEALIAPRVSVVL